jgi:hypothetical protein
VVVVGQNVRVRKLLIGVIATVTAVVVGAVGADFGAAIYAEYRLARSLRGAANLGWDPSVGILGFPFIPQAMRRHYDEVEIKASGVDHAVVGKASLEATLHSIDLADASWLIRPDAKLQVGKVESRIIIDSTHVGRFMGIPDLLVEAPSRETNDATGGTTNRASPAIAGWCSPAARRKWATTRRSASRSTCRSPGRSRPRLSSRPPAC